MTDYEIILSLVFQKKNKYFYLKKMFIILWSQEHPCSLILKILNKQLAFLWKLRTILETTLTGVGHLNPGSLTLFYTNNCRGIPLHYWYISSISTRFNLLFKFWVRKLQIYWQIMFDFFFISVQSHIFYIVPFSGCNILEFVMYCRREGDSRNICFCRQCGLSMQ